MIQPIRSVELAFAKGMGQVTFADHLIAEGKLPPADDPETRQPSLAEIEATFMDCELDGLQEKAEAVKEAINSIEVIEAALMEKVGAKQTVGFAPLTEILKELNTILSSQLIRRGVGVPEEKGEGENGETIRTLSGEINSREDVIRVLDKVCEYYQRHEPSSPIPLLLMRAKRLVTKEFIDIVRDLAPTGLQEIEKIRGPE